MKTKIIIASVFVFVVALISINSFSVCAQTGCVLKSYVKTITLTGQASQGTNNQFPQTLAQIQQASSTTLNNVVASQYANDVVQCDLKCRDRVTNTAQFIQCVPKMTFKLTPTSYDCNLAGTQCSASTSYSFLCNCKENNGNG